MGELPRVLKEMDGYWGEMIRLGATSIWESFDPRETGAEHYNMYDRKFAKSLCHAWGASPIYLLGKYFLGVDARADGYTVSPRWAGSGGWRARFRFRRKGHGALRRNDAAGEV